MCFKILVVIYLMTQGRHSNAAFLQRLPFAARTGVALWHAFPAPRGTAMGHRISTDMELLPGLGDLSPSPGPKN